MKDITLLYQPILEGIPTPTSGDEFFVFSEQNLPIPPEQIDTNTFYIQRRDHGYDDYFRADQLWVFADKQTLRYIALLTLSVIFHAHIDQIHVHITHPWSDIKHLIIRFIHPSLKNPHTGYATRPYIFTYFPKYMSRYPWLFEDNKVQDFPTLFLTNLQESVIDWSQRDTVIGFGGDTGTIRFAELLLNASLPDSTTDEYVLEGEGGYRGVGIHSAEVRLLMPGSFAWVDQAW
jgi:hypothetical protein